MNRLAMVKLGMVGLPEDAALKVPSELSGGMIKRVALARGAGARSAPRFPR